MAELPRSALIARFGEEGARMHARANGEELDAVPAATGAGTTGLALPLEPAVGDLEPLRFVLRRLVGGAGGSARGPWRGHAAGAPAPRAGRTFSKRRHAGSARLRAAPARAHGRSRGDRAAPLRAAGADTAAGAGGAPGAGAGRGGAGRRPAVAVVRAPGRTRGTPRLAAGAPRADLRRGSHPAGGARRPEAPLPERALALGPGHRARAGRGVGAR